MIKGALIGTILLTAISYQNFSTAEEINEQAYTYIEKASDGFETSNYDKCIYNAKKALDLVATSAEAHTLLGRCYERAGEFVSSHQTWVRLAIIHPDQQQAFRNRFVLALKLFDLKECKIALALWEKRFPNDPELPAMTVLYKSAVEFAKSNVMPAKQAKEIIKGIYLQKEM